MSKTADYYNIFAIIFEFSSRFIAEIHKFFVYLHPLFCYNVYTHMSAQPLWLVFL